MGPHYVYVYVYVCVDTYASIRAATGSTCQREWGLSSKYGEFTSKYMEFTSKFTSDIYASKYIQI